MMFWKEGFYMEFNQFNLYAMNASGENTIPKKDEVDVFIDEIRNIDEYNDIKILLEEKFGTISGEKRIDYADLKKQLYILVDEDKIEVCSLKNNQQYFGMGWKLLDNEK